MNVKPRANFISPSAKFQSELIRSILYEAASCLNEVRAEAAGLTLTVGFKGSTAAGGIMTDKSTTCRDNIGAVMIFSSFFFLLLGTYRPNLCLRTRGVNES